MRHTCWHVALEPIPARYSEQWLNCINREFTKYAKEYSDAEWTMVDLLGESIPADVTAGGFLNFAATNAWKASQVVQLSHLFSKGYIQPGDVFLFTDAWNPAILHVKYMIDLLKIPARIVSYWHAGSYDKWDTLGYTIKDRSWSIAAERSFYHASDVNLFATKFHADFFYEHCLDLPPDWSKDPKMMVSGQPHYEIIEWFKQRRKKDLPAKENLVVFPHRLCVEKQPEIFDQLAKYHPEWVFARTQDMDLSKEAYYELLLRAKVVFSAAQHEMLGISQMEAVLANAFPLMPNRLSYKELFEAEWLYPSEWNLKSQVDYVGLDATLTKWMAEDPNQFPWTHKLDSLRGRLSQKYLTSDPMWRAILGETYVRP